MGCKQGDPGSFQVGEHSNVLEGCCTQKGHKDSMYSPPNHLILCLMYFFHVAVPGTPYNKLVNRVFS